MSRMERDRRCEEAELIGRRKKLSWFPSCFPPAALPFWDSAAEPGIYRSVNFSPPLTTLTNRSIIILQRLPVVNFTGRLPCMRAVSVLCLLPLQSAPKWGLHFRFLLFGNCHRMIPRIRIVFRRWKSSLTTGKLVYVLETIPRSTVLSGITSAHPTRGQGIFPSQNPWG